MARALIRLYLVVHIRPKLDRPEGTCLAPLGGVVERPRVYAHEGGVYARPTVTNFLHVD